MPASKPSPPKRGWGVSQKRIGDAVQVGLAFRRAASQLVRSGQVKTMRGAVKRLRNNYW